MATQITISLNNQITQHPIPTNLRFHSNPKSCFYAVCCYIKRTVGQIALERTSEGLPRVSKNLVNDYSEKIEATAAKLATPVPDVVAFHELRVDTSMQVNFNKKEEKIITSPGLRRRLVSSSTEHRGHDSFESTDSSPVKLDAEAQTHIMKRRKLQEDLTDEMVVLAQQLKENSLKMNKSIQKFRENSGIN